tara:strand:- start:1133 stop:1261 length:129 start_codon:yes stop_codon:yes gene_type:complete
MSPLPSHVGLAKRLQQRKERMELLIKQHSNQTKPAKKKKKKK